MPFSLLRRRSICWLIALPLLLPLVSCSLVGSNTPQQHSPTLPNLPSAAKLQARSFADTWNNIHPFLAFDHDISNPAALAKSYDFVWGAQVSHIAAYRAANPSIFLTYYMPFYRDNGAFSNSLATHDLAYWKAIHPDWILYKCDRVTPAYFATDPQIPFDFTNPDVISWQIQTYVQPASEKGYDGIAADNVDLGNLFGACGVYIHGKWVQKYTGQPDDPQWRANVLLWLARMQAALHSLKHPLALIPNLALEVVSPTDPLVEQILRHVDGVVNEVGFTDSGKGYLTDSQWVQMIQFMEHVQSLEKPYYVVNQFPSVGHAEIQWALASYLMGKDHLAELFISTIQGYGAKQQYQEYGAQLGNPIDSMQQTQNIYIRRYSQGLSIVNPSTTHSYTVTINGAKHYRDLYGKSVGQTITLPPHSGIVLVTSS
jgi:hypothetical protein